MPDFRSFFRPNAAENGQSGPRPHIALVDELHEHKTNEVIEMLRAGFNVGVNTDNRLMSGVMPSSELRAVTDTFGLTSVEVERLVTNAVSASFAPIETRTRIIDGQVRPWFALDPVV